jgi:drug/metabolite transporter (DMT)-like permease
MRLTRLPIEATTLLYVLTYVPYMLIVRALSTTSNDELGRPLTGLETLPATLLISTVMLVIFIWWSGWVRSAHHVTVGGWRIPAPTRWTFIAGIGTSFLLFTVPLSLTFEGVSIPFIQLIMRGDVLIIAPLVDLLAGRRVRWWSWLALGLVSVGIGLTMWERGGLHMPPLAIFAVVLYTIGYFMRLSVMTRIAKNGDEDALKGYFVEEKIVAMPLAIVGLSLVTLSPLSSQGAELAWGFIDVWSSDVLPLLALLAFVFTFVAVFAALILLDPRENTFCVPFERAASILAGTITAYLLALMFGQAPPTRMEVLGTVLLIVAIAVLSLAPRWEAARRTPAGPSPAPARPLP